LVALSPIVGLFELVCASPQRAAFLRESGSVIPRLKGTLMAPKPKTPKTKPTSVRFDPEIKAAADKAAADDARSLSSLIQKAVAEYLRRKGKLRAK